MFVIDRSLYLSPEVVGEPGLRPLKEVDPFSLEALVAWLERQPGEIEYCYMSNGNCLIAQYLRYRGIPFRAVVGGGEYFTHDDERHSTSTDFHFVAINRPRDMKSALSRARKLLAEREK